MSIYWILFRNCLRPICILNIHIHKNRYTFYSEHIFFIFLFLAFDFCRFCVVIRFFFIPATTANDLWLRRISIPIYQLHYFLILILEKEPVFPFLMLNAKQRKHWYHFYSLWYDAVLDWGLNPGPPALEASPLPLGYRGGRTHCGIFTWGSFFFTAAAYMFVAMVTSFSPWQPYQ